MKPVLRLYAGSVLTRKDHPLTAATAAAFEPAPTGTGSHTAAQGVFTDTSPLKLTMLGISRFLILAYVHRYKA